MALQVTHDPAFQTPYGTTEAQTYWRWVNLSLDVPAGQANLVLYGFVDEAAFNTGKQNIGQKSYVVSGADFMALAVAVDGPEPSALSEVVYSHVQSVDEFFDGAATV